MLESLFNKISGYQACNFVKKRLQHRYFLVKTTTKHLQTTASVSWKRGKGINFLALEAATGVAL